MCVIVSFSHTKERCETQGELAAMIGKVNLVPDPVYVKWEYKEKNCLCAIDLKKSGEKAGYDVMLLVDYGRSLAYFSRIDP